jgi:retinal rod rhodopsin-sensitive cGMP 3',5'-cyclic phosphodiesterase subunit delta
MFDVEMQERVPRSILECRAISREINFSSRFQINSFRLEQRVYFHGHCIEQWHFKFGFVIGGSTNNWQQVIEAAPKEQMLKAEELSGNVVFETSFYDGDLFICKNSVRIFYL